MFRRTVSQVGEANLQRSSLPGAAENKAAELIKILKGHIKLET
jgi:hypothetical protein